MRGDLIDDIYTRRFARADEVATEPEIDDLDGEAMTDEPRETFLVRVWIKRRHLHNPRWVIADSDVMGETWVDEDHMQAEDKKTREEAKKCSQ